MTGYDSKHASLHAGDTRRIGKSPSQWFGSVHYPRPSQSSLDLMYSTRGMPEGRMMQHDGDFNRYQGQRMNQHRSNYESTHSEFVDLPVRKPPLIRSFSPQNGIGGSTIQIYISSEYDMQAGAGLIFSLNFADKRVAADARRMDSIGGDYEYLVYGTIPHFVETRSASTKVLLQLQLQEASGHDAGLTPVGSFEYTMGQLQSSPSSLTRKRKISDVNALAIQRQAYNDYVYPSQVNTNQMGNFHDTGSYAPAQSNRQNLAELSMGHSSAMPRAADRAQLSSTAYPAGWEGETSYATNSMRRMFDMTPQTSSLSSSSHSNPILVRTTTLHQADNAANGAATAVAGTPPNHSTGASSNAASTQSPYMYPQKAVLRILGDLNSMTENWTANEWVNKRRLVQFNRAQNKSTINATFAPVAPEDRPKNSICISCIWWEERQECYATSVDTIQLLESLVALRFTVEEKNRIRRNLEGFHPETVSKAKPESEEFFKVIMGFPAPKPRNIEKDVKVFPWKVLGHALKKIISKYSASYAPSTSMMATPRTMAGAPDTVEHASGLPSSTMSTPNPATNNAIFYAADSPGLSTPRGQQVIKRSDSTPPYHQPTPLRSQTFQQNDDGSNSHPSVIGTPNLSAEFSDVPPGLTTHNSSGVVTPATHSTAYFQHTPSTLGSSTAGTLVCSSQTDASTSGTGNDRNQAVTMPTYHQMPSGRALSGSAIMDYDNMDPSRSYKRPRANTVGQTRQSFTSPLMSTEILGSASEGRLARSYSEQNLTHASSHLPTVSESHASEAVF